MSSRTSNHTLLYPPTRLVIVPYGETFCFGVNQLDMNRSTAVVNIHIMSGNACRCVSGVEGYGKGTDFVNLKGKADECSETLFLPIKEELN